MILSKEDSPAPTVRNLFELGIRELSGASESPRIDAMLTLAHVMRHDRSWLVAHSDAAPSISQMTQYLALIKRRCSGVPVAYLLKTALFYGREFLVNEHVLVPRPETEHLIDEATAFINSAAEREMRVLDVGTGCGVIACTIAAQTPATVDATDSSAAAIELARENARRLRVGDRVHFHCGDLAEPVTRHRYDVVLANLPYIPTSDLPQPPASASFEPHSALDGGHDGLALYRRLLPKLPPLIKEGGMVLLEAAPPTIHQLRSLVRITFPNLVISVEKDYSALDRYIKAYDVRGRSRQTG